MPAKTHTRQERHKRAEGRDDKRNGCIWGRRHGGTDKQKPTEERQTDIVIVVRETMGSSLVKVGQETKVKGGIVGGGVIELERNLTKKYVR